MQKATHFTEIEPVETSQDVLTQLARRGAQKMLAVALEDEVAQYVDHHSGERDNAGRRIKFTSKILPPYLRRTKAIEELIPWLAFYDFPTEHWKHFRTTNPIESTFATVRLRTKRTKGSGFTLPRGVGWPRAVTRPGLPQIRTCAIDASGSSRWRLRYVWRKTECMARADGSG